MALGRGINAIFEDIETAYSKDFENSSAQNVLDIKIDDIKPNPYQPRKTFDALALKELSNSIKQYGLLQPIIVLEKNKKFILIAGERRLRASKLAGVKTIKSIIVDLDQGQLRELALIENIQREDLNAIELANSYKELLQKHNITQESLSSIVHKSRTQISNTLRLLSLGKKTQKFVIDAKISQGHAKVLVGLEPEIEEQVVNSIIGQKLSVRDTEQLVQNLKRSKNPQAKDIGKKIVPFKQISTLTDILRSKSFKFSNKNNSITINFQNSKEVQKFIDTIS